MKQNATMGISLCHSVPDKASKRFHPAIRLMVWTRLVWIGALFAASHARANETHQVVSENGTTNIVERIDFPVGDIKDIIPAGDKYIIHANPIDSLKDGVAVDALFVMEKANPNAAFGRTFSTPIHSVAYVPGLDIAVWSYDTTYSTNMVNVKTGFSALSSAASVTKFDSYGYEFDPKSKLFGLDGNMVFEIRPENEFDASTGARHVFINTENGYVEDLAAGSPSFGHDKTVVAHDEHGVFVARADKPNQLVHCRPDVSKTYKNISDLEFSSNMAKLSSSETDGHLFIENSLGNVQSRVYTADSVGIADASTVVWNNLAISSMATSKSNNVLCVVSTGTNEVFESNATLTNTDRVVPNPSETGYRKVITDGNNALLLSNTHSYYFYRIQKTR